MFLASCEKTKDAQYFYDHPAEIKTIGEECDNKVKQAETEEDLLKLKENVLCKNAMLAALAVRLGDLKNAVLIEDKQGWGAFIDSKILITQKIKEDERQLAKIIKSSPAEIISALDKEFVNCKDVFVIRQLNEEEQNFCINVNETYLSVFREKFNIIKNSTKNERFNNKDEIFNLYESCSKRIYNSINKLCEELDVINREVNGNRTSVDYSSIFK